LVEKFPNWKQALVPDGRRNTGSGAFARLEFT